MKLKVLKRCALLTCLVFALSACTTVNPYTEEKQASKLAIGAGIGAASGAVIGLLTSNNKNRQRNVLLGAGIAKQNRGWDMVIDAKHAFDAADEAKQKM